MRCGPVLTLAVVLVVAACGDRTGDGAAVGSPIAEPPSADPTVMGVITAVDPLEPVAENCVEPETQADPDSPVSSEDTPVCSDPDNPLLGHVLVEEDPRAASGDVKVRFAVEEGTALLNRVGETYEPVSFLDLVEGATVSAWADGAIMESYPAQATASVIVLEGGGP